MRINQRLAETQNNFALYRSIKIYRALILAPLVWIPFSYSGDFSKIWITGLILAAGSLWTLKQIANENHETKFLSMAVRNLKASAILTLILAIFLIFSSFLYFT